MFIERLVVQVKEMITESGSPKAFDAERWVNEWLNQPLSTLDGAMPIDYMDTIERQQLISKLVAQMESVAYA